MIWTDWASFWDMGGQAAYVWGSVAAAVAALVIDGVVLAARDRECARGDGRRSRGTPP